MRKENFPTSEGKIFFRLDGTFEASGSQYVWTIGKGIYGIFENEELIYVGETGKRNIKNYLKIMII